MKDNQITSVDYGYLVYAYVSISTFVLMSISKLTENLERALNFNTTVTIFLILNILVFIASFLIKRKHNIDHK